MSGRLVGSVLLLTFLGVRLWADETGTRQNTLTHVQGAPRPNARIDDVSWITGHWKGEGLGGISEEIWSAPLAGSMLGSYRMIKDGRAVFYELCTISEESGSLTLRIKHFHPDLTGWEEKSEVRVFPLVKLATNVAYFDGITFRKLPSGELEAFVRIRRKNGQEVEERFSYRPIAERDRKAK
jgi:hypothetical protein